MLPLRARLYPAGCGERWAVLQRLDLGFGVGVVVGHVGSAVAAGNAEVDEELRDRLRGHRCPAVGVQRELPGRDAVAGEGVGDERFGELAGLGASDGPPDDVAAEDVDDHQQVVELAPRRALKLGVGVGPQRPVRLSTGGFLRPALRTGRARSRASGSPRGHAAGAGGPVVALVHGVGILAPR